MGRSDRACHVRGPCGAPASGVAVVMPPPDYAGYRFPSDVIQRAVWMYLRFTLSYRDVEDLLAERGVEASYETIRRWVTTFGPLIARRLRARRPVPHRRWHLDEMFVRVGGKLMRTLLRKQGIAPIAWVTNKCPAYGATLCDLRLDGIPHLRAKRQNNRAESSHVPVRRREWKRQGFKSAASAQRFLSMHAATYNTFNVCRHLTTARTHRLSRAEAFAAWRDTAGAAA